LRWSVCGEEERRMHKVWQSEKKGKGTERTERTTMQTGFVHSVPCHVARGCERGTSDAFTL